jgi:hypothetical protein
VPDNAPVRRRLTPAFSGIALLVLTAALAGAQAPGCRQQGEVHVCEAEGFGTIINNDVAQARDEARIDVGRKALEQVAGIQVDAETITRNQVLFDQLVRTQSRGLVETLDVLEEGKLADGRYRVRGSVRVKATEVQERIESLVSELSLVVLIPEQNLGTPSGQPIVENEIVSRLVEAGYRVLDFATVQKLTKRDQMAALLRGDEQVAREIGLKFLSNLIVIGQATNQGILSAHARVTARAIESETGRVVANVSLDQIRGFGGSPEAAGERALVNAAKPSAERLLQALDAFFKRKERRIDVRVRNLPNLDEYRRAKAFLEKQRWVSDVAEGGFAGEVSVITLTYPEKTLYLASRLGQDPRYRLLEFDRSRILMEYKP